MTFSAGGAVLVMWKSNHRSCQASDSPTAIPVSETKGLSELIKKWRNDEREHHRALKKLIDKPFFRISAYDIVAGFKTLDVLEERYKISKRKK